jgi:DNA-binding CsgD family transcriptional regulator
VLDQVERLCAGALDAKGLRERTLAVLRRAVAFDAHVWTLTDPVSRVGTSPLADVPGLSWDDLPRLVRTRYLSRGTRWTDLIQAGARVGSLYEATAGDLNASLAWREIQRPLGVVDVLTAAFWDRFGCWAWLDLWRRTPGKPFTRAEQALVASLVPTLTTGLRAAQARTFATAPRRTPAGPAVLVLSPELAVQLRTSAAQDDLQRLNPPDDPTVATTAIPAAAYNIAAALIAHELGVPVGPPWSRVHLGAGRWVTLRADRTSAGEIAVSIEDSAPTERLEVFGLTHGLSPREREVLAELSTGADSRQLAQRLTLSEHTVNDHIKAVLAKAGSPSRTALLARVAGTG